MKRYAFLFLLPLIAGAAPNSHADTAPLTRLMGLAMSDGKTAAIAESLTDHVGARPSGSPGAARAVQWAVEQMKALGLKNVHTEKVMTPHWIRGDAAAEIVGPDAQKLAVMALGPSVATPPEGLTAEVVEVHGFDELKALGDVAKGKIVLFHHVMKRGNSFAEYGAAQAFRSRGATAAARAGAVASLIRSAGTGAFRLPHTGALRYDDGVTKIPAGALSAEDADLIHRRLRAGEHVRVHLMMSPHLEAPVESANVVGEVPGRERPQEIVLLGAHLDSWDLGTGAVDDGAGCAVVLDAARAIAALGQAPRRTVRVVLFMNEEMGLDGAKAYAQRHDGELGKHVAAMEVDSGAGRPTGWGALGGPSATALLTRLAQPLGTIGAATVIEGDEAGADLSPMQGRVPLLGLGQDLSNYFDWHHTAADTFDKIDALELAMNTAAIAVMAYQLADIAEVLPMSPPPKGHW
jgi:Zn-dependent M28 family amino/carboxypeptidase